MRQFDEDHAVLVIGQLGNKVHDGAMESIRVRGSHDDDRQEVDVVLAVRRIERNKVECVADARRGHRVASATSLVHECAFGTETLQGETTL